MMWAVAAVICGLLAPWIILPKEIIAGFGRGVQSGLTAWASIGALTVPLMLLVFLIAQLLFG
jgi:hypothetical protein